MGLLEIRGALNLSQRQVAERANVSQSMVAKTEVGSANPTVHILRSIATAVCCTVNDLVDPVAPERINEIRAAYHRREAERAEAEARAQGAA